MVYCAFLRGVNVKGTNMKMSEVVCVFESAGLENVSSVLATGNIIFTSDQEPEAIKKNLEKDMSKHFSYDAHLFLQSKAEIENIFNNNPFKSKPENHIYVFVGKKGIENTLWEEFNKSPKSESEDAQIVKNNFYWQIEKGFTLASHFGKILGNKNLKDCFTSRNLNTFEKIVKKMKP